MKNTRNVKDILKKEDGLIAFPTDTVWGIGCLVENQAAVERIYSLKGRSKDKPLILLGSKLEYLLPYVKKMPEKALEIAQKYFPGAVTIVVEKSEKTPDYMTSGFNTVGIRIPDCPAFIDMLNDSVESHVLATTSANISGESATDSQQTVEATVGKDVDFILDSKCFQPKGAESTVILVNEDNTYKILRQGSIFIS